MFEFLNGLWAAEARLLPLVTALLIFELSNIARRLTHIAYTPIYFAFFPLGHADSHYAYYFNEDELYVGESMSKKQKHKLRKKIVSVSSISLAISTIINPLICGIFSALFLHNNEFKILFWTVAIVKSSFIIKSLYDNRYTSFVDESGAYPWLCFIYILFIGSVLYILEKSYHWASDRILDGGIAQLSTSILDAFFGEIVIGFVIAAMLGGAISYFMTDEDFIPEPNFSDANDEQE